MRLFLYAFRPWLLAAILCAAAVPAFAQNSTTLPSCSSGDPVVWVNTSSKVYHLKGDRYFGNTKSGNYECKSAADKAGYRQAQVSPVGTKSPSAARPAGPTPTATHHSWFGFGNKPTAAPTAAARGASPAPSPHSSHKPRHHKPKASPSPGPVAT